MHDRTKPNLRTPKGNYNSLAHTLFELVVAEMALSAQEVAFRRPGRVQTRTIKHHLRTLSEAGYASRVTRPLGNGHESVYQITDAGWDAYRDG